MFSDIVQVFARADGVESAVDPGAGGVQTRNQFPGGFTESVWVATFTMFIVWLLALVLCPLAATTGARDKFAVVQSLPQFSN